MRRCVSPGGIKQIGNSRGDDMSKAEMIAMLATKSVSLDAIHGGQGGLTQMDVAAMLSKLKDHEFKFLSAKYAKNDIDFAHTYRRWLARVEEQNFSSSRIGINEALASATLQEHIDGLLCRDCNGVGQFIVDKKVLLCENCNGLGRRHWSNREMARKLHLKTNELKEPWLSRVRWCRDELRVWEATALSKMQ